MVFGGSGSYISVDTNMIEESLEEETVCINMAVNGWFNGVAQVEMMLHYVQEGDTYLHMPETSSQFGAMYGTSMIPGMSNFNYNRVRFYCTLESNYDLLSLVDFRHVTYLLTGFNLFNNNRKSMEATTYTDFKTSVNLYGTIYENDLAYIDDRGNFTLPHPAGKNVKDAGEADIVVEYVEDEEAHNRLNHYFDEFRSRGVNVFFSPAAVNLDTLELRREDPELFQDATNGYLFYGRPDGIPLPDYDDMDEWVEDYMDAIHTYYDVDFLLPLDQVLYRTQDYWKPDYHLGDEISPGYTQDLIDALESKGYAMKEVD